MNLEEIFTSGEYELDYYLQLNYDAVKESLKKYSGKALEINLLDYKDYHIRLSVVNEVSLALNRGFIAKYIAKLWVENDFNFSEAKTWTVIFTQSDDFVFEADEEDISLEMAIEQLKGGEELKGAEKKSIKRVFTGDFQSGNQISPVEINKKLDELKMELDELIESFGEE